MSDFTYTFPVVEGMQNGRKFYQATVPFRVLASMLKLDDNPNVNKRSQRLVNKKRGKDVCKYLEKNKDGFFVIPPLVGLIDGDFSFEEVPLDGFEMVGRLKVAIEAKLSLFDGQHRSFGIRESMVTCPELSHHSASIMIFEKMSLAERKQAFHDINFTQKTPAAALCIAYNERSEFDKTVVDIISKSVIRDRVEYEKNAVSGANDNLFSLKTFKDFFVNLIGKEVSEYNAEFAEQFVDELFTCVNIKAWMIANEHLSTPQKIRSHMVVSHSVMLQAFGLLGASLLTNYPNDWKAKLVTLKDLNLWYQDNKRWAGRCVNEKGKMISNKMAVRLTSYELKRICGVSLSPDENVEENQFLYPINHETAA